MFFSQKLSAIGKISIIWSENKHKTIETAEMLKFQGLTHFLNI